MQDMLDIDIRSEVATVVGGVSEFTSLMNDLPSLDLESNSNDGDILWSSGQKWPTTNDIYADVGACINPNSVHTIAPVTQSSILMSPKAQLNLNTHNYHSNNSPLPSPKEKKSHLTFSPNTIKVPVVQENKKQSLLCQPQRTNVEAIKKDLTDDLREEKVVKHLTHSMTVNGQTNGHNTIKLAAGIGGLSFANSQMYAKLKQNNSKIVANGNITHLKRDSSPLNNTSNMISNSSSLNGHSNSQKMFARSISVQNSKSHISTQHILPSNSLSHHNGVTKQMKPKITGQEFPKPAYSYSCLIAMALKNSRAGSLPVSEIYSFMCEHFPYFKTAPNGWKNSVRHNLSLNKCFEKIEKPVTNGGQRKGCLWAMNPSKITKMDEEIQKWSRKDPMAIRKAMVYPDNLELLEKGEMKHGSTGDSEGENEVGDEDTETNTDSEQDGTELDDTIQNTTEPESCDEDDRPQIDYDIEVMFCYTIAMILSLCTAFTSIAHLYCAMKIQHHILQPYEFISTFSTAIVVIGIPFQCSLSVLTNGFIVVTCYRIIVHILLE